MISEQNKTTERGKETHTHECLCMAWMVRLKSIDHGHHMVRFNRIFFMFADVMSK